MNIENTIFYMWVIWYFYAYGPPPLINHFFIKFYFIIDKLMIKYNNYYILIFGKHLLILVLIHLTLRQKLMTQKKNACYLLNMKINI